MQKEMIYIASQSAYPLEMLKMRLMTEGYDVGSFQRYDELKVALSEAAPPPDLLILLDTGEEGGILEMCMRLRDLTSTLIFIISAQANEMFQISTLSAGADECLLYPFSMGVLIAKIHAFFRRSKLCIRPEEKVDQYLIDLPDLKIDVKRRVVIVQYKHVTLTSIEFDILALLAGSPNQVFYTSQIFQNVWDTNSILTGDDKTVTVHISNLRRKVEIDPLHPKYIITVRSVGYKFAMPS